MCSRMGSLRSPLKEKLPWGVVVGTLSAGVKCKSTGSDVGDVMAANCDVQ